MTTNESEYMLPADENRSGPTLVGHTDSSVIDTELFIKRAFEINDEKGYELLFKRYYQPLCSHAVRFVYSKEIAEDLVMEVFSRFWQKQLHRGIVTSYRSYLFTTVRHAAFAYLRTELHQEKNNDYAPDTTSDNTPVTPQQLLQFNELYLKIEEIIRSTSPQSQRVFLMSRFEGKKNAMIAEELQLSIKTVEGHITKVLSLLRQSLRNYGLLAIALLSTFLSHSQGLFTYFLFFIEVNNLHL
ncbi:MAG: RNA polymerase sigma-70 factor [Spirosomataceae bacterium]